MLYLMHEKVSPRSPRINSQAAVRPCRKSPGSLDRYKDCGFIAGTGGPASGMDNSSIGSNPHEFESVDSWGEQRRCGVSSTKTSTWPPWATDRGSCPKIARSSGEKSSWVWLVTCWMGWSNPGCSFEEIFWDKPEGSTSPVLDASVGLSDEACQLCVCSGPFWGCQALSSVVKKSSETLSQKRRLSFKMRQGLARILDWAGDGQNVVNLLKFLRQANIESVWIFLAGWHLFWGHGNSFEPSEGIVRPFWMFWNIYGIGSKVSKFGFMQIKHRGIKELRSENTHKSSGTTPKVSASISTCFKYAGKSMASNAIWRVHELLVRRSASYLGVGANQLSSMIAKENKTVMQCSIIRFYVYESNPYCQGNNERSLKKERFWLIAFSGGTWWVEMWAGLVDFLVWFLPFFLYPFASFCSFLFLSSSVDPLQD